jgi:hypothetical protein
MLNFGYFFHEDKQPPRQQDASGTNRIKHTTNALSYLFLLYLGFDRRPRRSQTLSVVSTLLL